MTSARSRGGGTASLAPRPRPPHALRCMNATHPGAQRGATGRSSAQARTSSFAHRIAARVSSASTAPRIQYPLLLRRAHPSLMSSSTSNGASQHTLWALLSTATLRLAASYPLRAMPRHARGAYSSTCHHKIKRTATPQPGACAACQCKKTLKNPTTSFRCFSRFGATK